MRTHNNNLTQISEAYGVKVGDIYEVDIVALCEILWKAKQCWKDFVGVVLCTLSYYPLPLEINSLSITILKPISNNKPDSAYFYISLSFNGSP